MISIASGLCVIKNLDVHPQLSRARVAPNDPERVQNDNDGDGNGDDEDDDDDDDVYVLDFPDEE